MRDVVIVEAVRTPVGKFRGGLKDVRADHLGALVLDEVIKRANLGAEVVDDVVFGCVTQVGEQCGNIARTSLLSAGWPETIPGMTVDRKCGSSEAAIHVAMGEIASGACDIVVAGGAENMSRVPMGGNRDVHGEPFGWRLRERFHLTSQGEAAERLCDLWGLSRDDIDDFAIESHRRAARAADAGWFEREIVPVPVAEICEQGVKIAVERVAADETIRRDTSREKLATLKTSFRPEGGRVTAGNASQISDGAAALLLMSADKAKALGLKPRARIRAVTTVGSDPELMLTGPIAATRRAVERAGLALGDIDLFEVNEAFAPVPMIWMRELGIGHDRLNVNGGAIALGHPLGGSGARIMTTLLHELERRGATFGAQAICCAGGLGTATVIERLG
ncbi:DitO-like Thiolase, possibly related to diterpenoid metabolism (plasmid) [Aromatoleum aromaticum EbN1]|uniref:DitO-like Thiolase, possibly related to diterpenoid metabolism n=1 Tax=Aromatoleum aromaticum (strain DSM 19018 / LMG 30748 / EbN1) TaxID=76114 RepID=Q5NW49_AROAE|nr:thiolase family protein [Aromatoleum aromaticum]CAI10715.1 DitO-like Thiolase, possibly related to diterpenoid metabolism [Aromatoleum aromaticum EbN1]